ncbi:MAG: D-alanyl-D-alanine carboxypeptidase family protein [bacterium]|nr:D-alanyl-D-alanine carboxypeptidase family protein [bacterium]
MINKCKSKKMDCSVDISNKQNCVLTNLCKNPLLPFSAVGLGGEQLPKDFVPSNLISASSIPNVISQSGIQVNNSAAEALGNYGQYIKNQGYTLYITSGYRSYSEQTELHQGNPNGAAPPGESQHQTGLAVDLYLVNDQGKLSAIPGNLISAAPQFGMAHPLGWDRPHFFVLSGILGDTNSWEDTFNPIGNTNNDYVTINNAIIKMQKECKLL